MKKVKRGLFFSFILLFFCVSPSLFSIEKTTSLRERILHGKEGDFIVTNNNKIYTLILIKQITPLSLTLEEISVPENQMDKEKNWAKWVANFAPAHSSWSGYEIDLTDNSLKGLYSFTKNAWLDFDHSDYIVAHFLTLPLKKTPNDERQRIGPSPLGGEMDTRSLWIPSLFFEGKKREKPSFEVVKGRWPKDGLLISECDLEFYFDASSSFPFPYWLDIKGTHYTFRLPIVDSGKGAISPQQNIPLRPPEFIGGMQRSNGKVTFTLKCPSHCKNLTLYAADATGMLAFALPVPFTKKESEEKGKIILEIHEKDLNSLLKSGHRYRWIVIPQDAGSAYAETEDAYLWKASE